MFQPLRWRDDSNITTTTTTDNNNNCNNNTWLLTRQPFMRHRLPNLQVHALIPPSSPLSSSPHQQEPKKEPLYSPWTLWDNRFWFRCAIVPFHRRSSAGSGSDAESSTSPYQNGGDIDDVDVDVVDVPIQPDSKGQWGPGNTSVSLVLRPLQQDDLQRIRRGRPQRHHRRANSNISTERDPNENTAAAFAQLMERLTREAPGQSRFTVPVLTVQADDRGGDFSGMEEHLLALPTMGVRFPIEFGSEGIIVLRNSLGLWKVQWEWMYKSTDNEPLRLMGWLEDG